MSKKQQFITDDELVLVFRDNKSIQITAKEKGKIITKIIGIETLMECFKASLGGIKINTGLLPSNIVCVSVDTDRESKYCVVEYPYDKADITYMNTVYKDFPLPRLLFGFSINDSGRITGVNLGVPNLGNFKENTQMFEYPFSNVSHFAMCTGANSLPHIKSLQSLKNLPDFILSLPDNDDHYKDSHNRLKLGHRDLMEHLKDKDRQYYYDHILVPMHNTTLKNFL